MSKDFSNQKLCGKAFIAQDIQGGHFDNADIRGVNFSEANLSNANFRQAKVGVATNWSVLLTLFLLIAVSLSTLITAYTSALIIVPEDNQPIKLVFQTGLPLVIALLILFVILHQGTGAALSCLGLLIAASVPIVAALAQYESGTLTEYVVGQVALRAIGLAGMVSGIVMTSSVVASGLALGSRLLAISLGAVMLPVSIAAIYEGIGDKVNVVDWPLSIGINLLVFALILHIGFSAISGDVKFQAIRDIAIRFATFKGTCFRGANLTDADFTQVQLKGTDFRFANLTRTRWSQSQWLGLARTWGTYLANPTLRKLVVTGQGQDQDFSNQNLQGLNLRMAQLSDASFIDADLSNADLQDANLSRAKLVKTKLYNTRFNRACLTGANIQDWAISLDTQFDAVECDYVYMHLPTPDDQDPYRKPDNRNEVFKSGDFTDFITPIIKTLDLYKQQNVDPRVVAATYRTVDLFHHEGIDPGAAAVAFQQLAEQNPEAGLEVVSLEGRRDDQIRLQARVSGKTDRSQLSAEYFEKYNEAAALPYGDLQSLLVTIKEKDERIQSLENMVTTAIESEKFYVETYYDFGKSAEDTQPVKKILILTANPHNVNRNRLDAEVRAIRVGLERAKKRDQFELISQWAVRTEDLRRALLDHEPQIVQFSGSGVDNAGLALENEIGEVQLVATAALASLFELFKDKVECVFLNACYSAAQTDAISQHIPYVIGMSHAIGERAALEFAVGFYDALGAGRSIDDAFKVGCISIDLEGLPESLIPILKKKDNLSPDDA